MTYSLKNLSIINIQKKTLDEENYDPVWENKLKSLPEKVKHQVCCTDGFFTLSPNDAAFFYDDEDVQKPIIMYYRKVNFGMLIAFKKVDKTFFKKFCDAFTDDFTLIAKDLSFLHVFYKKIQNIEDENILNYKQHKCELKFCAELPNKL